VSNVIRAPPLTIGKSGAEQRQNSKQPTPQATVSSIRSWNTHHYGISSLATHRRSRPGH